MFKLMPFFMASFVPFATPSVTYGDLEGNSLQTPHALRGIPEPDRKISVLSWKTDVVEPSQKLERRTRLSGSESGSAGHSGQPGKSLASGEEELGELNSRWLMSYKRRDRETLENILSDDFIGNYNGRARSKAEIIASTMNPARTVKEITWRDLQIRSNGAIAVVSGISTVRAQQGDAPETVSSSRYIDIYERRAGRWWAVAAHVTPVPNEQ